MNKYSTYWSMIKPLYRYGYMYIKTSQVSRNEGEHGFIRVIFSWSLLPLNIQKEPWLKLHGHDGIYWRWVTSIATMIISGLEYKFIKQDSFLTLLIPEIPKWYVENVKSKKCYLFLFHLMKTIWPYKPKTNMYHISQRQMCTIYMI